MAAGESFPILAHPIDEMRIYDWLRAKQYRWRHVIAARAALRVLPFGLHSASLRGTTPKAALALFRATAISRFMPISKEENIETDRERLY